LSLKVLIVDDEEFLRRIYAIGFEREGCTVCHADNGRDALKVAEEQKPDLIILDIVMPEMHGFEVCKTLRENPAFAKTTIVMSSAKSYKPDIDKALELGADAYIVKPIEFEELFKIAIMHYNKRVSQGT
jgi:DNA-binding response OmpR family regulator